jgi:ABC-type antimicrobial peptide transport system permease subunit
MKKGIAITLIIIGVIILLLGMGVFYWMATYIPTGVNVNIFSLFLSSLTSPPGIVSLILIGVGIYGLYKNKKK